MLLLTHNDLEEHLGACSRVRPRLLGTFVAHVPNQLIERALRGVIRWVTRSKFDARSKARPDATRVHDEEVDVPVGVEFLRKGISEAVESVFTIEWQKSVSA